MSFVVVVVLVLVQWRSVHTSVWQIKRQYLLWLHLQMEHYENKQIFINDMYKGCTEHGAGDRGKQSQMEQQPHKRMPLLAMCVCMCVCLSTKNFQFERRFRHWTRQTAIGACKLSQQQQQQQQPTRMRQQQRQWEILDSRYYFSYGAPFVPWLQFVNFTRRCCHCRIDFHFIAK